MDEENRTTVTVENPLTVKVTRNLRLAAVLKVDPSGFEYEGKHYSFNRVTHLEWYCVTSSQSWPNNDVQLTFKITCSNPHETVNLTPTTQSWRKMHSALLDAYRYIASHTARQRLESYLVELERKGYIDYKSVRVWSNGNLEAKGRQFQLKDGSVSVFSIWFKIEDSLWPRHFTLETTTDNDILRPIIDEVLIYTRSRLPESAISLRIHGQMLREVEDPEIRKTELWALMFARTGGNVDVAKAMYIRERVSEEMKLSAQNAIASTTRSVCKSLRNKMSSPTWLSSTESDRQDRN